MGIGAKRRHGRRGKLNEKYPGLTPQEINITFLIKKRKKRQKK